MADDDQRLRTVETDLAVVKDRTATLAEQVRTFGPLVTEHEVLKERCAGMQRGLDDSRKDVVELHDDMETANKKLWEALNALVSQTKETTRWRVTTYISLGAIVVVAIGIVIAALSTGGHT